MNPDVGYMRDFLLNRYPGERWKNRVSEMNADQVIAIYFRMIEEKPTPEPPLPKPEEKEPPNDTLF
ncbi:MAG TPA: hypothetical protein VM715_15805 [Candidatus Acidoferrum sp.]|jgi:hypothetical protein|nr:hypothetical protein [Candidatus Acidoferrum sp.]